MASSRDRVASTPSTLPSARRRVSCATQELLDVLHEDVNLIQEKPYVPEPEDAEEDEPLDAQFDIEAAADGGEP